MSYSIDVNEKVEIVWLFCDQLFASFQVIRNVTALMHFTDRQVSKSREASIFRISTLRFLTFFALSPGLLRGGAILFPERRSED
jgi:hypothetical protein